MYAEPGLAPTCPGAKQNPKRRLWLRGLVLRNHRTAGAPKAGRMKEGPLALGVSALRACSCFTQRVRAARERRGYAMPQSGAPAHFPAHLEP